MVNRSASWHSKTGIAIRCGRLNAVSRSAVQRRGLVPALGPVPVPVPVPAPVPLTLLAPSKGVWRGKTVTITE
ncbi:MAG: hypothetical protein HOJ51_12415 [Tateyamaria sp.]|nr:hypothetical protein [Tateyamaria sp.]